MADKDTIRLLNDTFRLDPHRWGVLVVTSGVQAKGAATSCVPSMQSASSATSQRRTTRTENTISGASI